MNEQDYFDQRVADQINWYDKKSIWHKKWFMFLKVTETFLALLVPFFVGYITTEMVLLKVIVGLIGVIVAALASIITLYKFQENWIEYRIVAETLKHEKFLYITKAGPYKDIDTFNIFVERFESYISKENTQWTSYIKFKSEDKKNG
jgi:hypothetical protein